MARVKTDSFIWGASNFVFTYVVGRRIFVDVKPDKHFNLNDITLSLLLLDGLFFFTSLTTPWSTWVYSILVPKVQSQFFCNGASLLS